MGSAPTVATASVDGCVWFLGSNRMSDASRIDACWPRPGLAGGLPPAPAGIGRPFANLAVRASVPGSGVLPWRAAGVGRRGR
jgi:hypothetical protein